MLGFAVSFFFLFDPVIFICGTSLQSRRSVNVGTPSEARPRAARPKADSRRNELLPVTRRPLIQNLPTFNLSLNRPIKIVPEVDNFERAVI